MKNIVYLFALLLLSVNGFAQTKVERAEQAMDKGDYIRVIQYTTDQLKETPKDTKALSLRARAFLLQGDNAEALEDADAAIKCWHKKCDMTLGSLYCLRASVYSAMKQDSLALADYNTAIKKDKNDVSNYNLRANFYFAREQYAEAELDYRKAYELDKTNSEYALSMALCMILQTKYEDAAQTLDKIIRYEPMNTRALRLRALLAVKTEDYNTAIDYSVTALALDYDDLNVLLTAAVSEYAYALKTVSAKIKNAEDETERFYWYGVRVRIHQAKEQYRDALKDLQTMQTMLTDSVPNRFILYQSAACYVELYEYATAVKYYSKLIDTNPEADNFPAYLYLARGACYSNLGNYELALADYTKVIDEDFDYAPLAYCDRGVTHEEQKNYDDALQDYNKGLLLDESNLALHLYRGRLLLLQKQDTLRANPDFEYILAHDTTPQYSVRHYALLYSGHADEAAEWMNNVLEADPSIDNYYDAACLYARMNRPDEAMRYLKTTLDMGYRNLVHLEADDDLDSLRERQDYKDLIAKYKKEKVSSIFNRL